MDIDGNNFLVHYHDIISTKISLFSILIWAVYIIILKYSFCNRYIYVNEYMWMGLWKYIIKLIALNLTHPKERIYFMKILKLHCVRLRLIFNGIKIITMSVNFLSLFLAYLKYPAQVYHLFRSKSCQKL